MERPNDFDQTPEYSEMNQFEPGGHIMKILKVEETKSRAGNPMLKIYMDADKSDAQADYFKKKYDSSTFEDKKWGCIAYLLTVSTRSGGTNPAFKSFITSVEKSNSSSFKVKWGAQFAECFKGRLVGCVFRREQYVNNYGGKPKLSWSVKPAFFHSVAAINEGVEVPEDKPLTEEELQAAGIYDVVVSAESDVPPPSEPPGTTVTDDDYPF